MAFAPLKLRLYGALQIRLLFFYNFSPTTTKRQAWKLLLLFLVPSVVKIPRLKAKLIIIIIILQFLDPQY